MQRELSNLTECSICADTYSDPRTLPCVHTFCLRCIEGFSEHKLPGDRVSCPLCRKEFAIPENGAEDLPKNFFIEQLKHLVITSDGRCEEDEGADETDSASNKHQLRYCGQHKDRSIELYCHDCNAAICTRCFVESHKQHQYSDVSQVLGDFRNQLTDDIKEMSEAVSRYRDMLSNQEHSKRDFYSVIDEIEKQICKRTEQLITIVESEKRRMLQELQLKKKEREKLMHNAIEEIRQHISFGDGLIKYVQELRDKGTASDIAQQKDALHRRVDELKNPQNIHREINDLSSLKVRFEAAKVSVDGDESLVGQVLWQQADEVQHTTPPTPSLLHVVSADSCGQVVGMTSVDSNLFVLRYPSKQQIQVYDGTFIQSRPLQVGGLSDESNYGGLTSCATNNCLYVSDCWKDTVYRVDLLDKSIIRWQVEREPFGLSVSNVCNLLVACHDADKIQEYTSRGSLVREILLQSNDGDFSPWHAVQLTGDQFVVGSENDVAEVDTQGRVIVSYTNQLQSTSQQNFHDPRHLSVDKNLKHILVADCSNNRVMILNRSLKSCARELTATSLDVGLCQPSCLYFDELKNRLFVGEYRGQCRILVFENVI